MQNKLSLKRINLLPLREYVNLLRRFTSDSFVSKKETKSVYGWYTIKQGERAAIWYRNGTIKFVDGPQRVPLFGGSVQNLRQLTANPSQFIQVQYKNGKKEFIKGPACIWENPIEHDEIKLKEAISLNTNEAVIVYQENEGVVKRNIITGPKLLMPEGNEWIHNFYWHGADPAQPEKKKQGALRFSKLRVIPDQMYYDVEQVRTADDALITVKLMIFFQLSDIEKMLDTTHDPIADFINAATADVIDFMSQNSFESFKQKTELLNSLETYKQLRERAARIGYEVSKVVFRGYLASETLQVMHNNAIETRTKLILETEIEEQAQRLASFKVQKEMERSAQQLQIKESQTLHKIKMDNLTAEETMRQQKVRWESEREHLEKTEQIKQKSLQENTDMQANYVRKLKEMGVDLTEFLVAKEQGGPTKWIKFDSASNAKVHLHENK